MERVDYQSLIVQDLINLHERDELDLSPWYQRREVWTRPQKSYLINTLFVRKPIPTIYIRHKLDLRKEKSIREIVDGQQRIRAVLEYVRGDFAARHPDYEGTIKFSELRGRRKEKFLMTPLSVGWLQGANDSDVIEIFGRLNSVAKSLNDAEKRNARFGGEFKHFALEQAAMRLPIWREGRIFTATQISRMAEVQFVAELAMNMTDGLMDYSLMSINKYYRDNEEEFENREWVEGQLDEIFSLVAEVGLDSISQSIFRRTPLFFSLVIVLSNRNRFPTAKRLREAIEDIDENYILADDGDPVSREDAVFHLACKQNPHRIKNRIVRNDYINDYFD